MIRSREHVTDTTHVVVAFGIRETKSPFFTVTAAVYEYTGSRWRKARAGRLHDEVLAIWPDLAPLVALDGAGVESDEARTAIAQFGLECTPGRQSTPLLREDS